jgi:hypothetical protein
MEDQILTLELSVAEVNVVLRSLGKHPFDEIAQLINKIKTQGESQLTAPAEPDPGVVEAV